MSKPVMTSYPAAFTERAVQRAVASAQSMAHTARDLGGNDNTFHTGIGTYHRVERQEQPGQDAPLYEARKRRRKDKARVQEEREHCKKAAAACAPPLPCSTRGAKRRPRRLPSGV